MNVCPITRQTYDYATPNACDNNLEYIIDSDPDTDDQDVYILAPEPIKRKHHSCLHLLKLKLQYDPIISQLKM